MFVVDVKITVKVLDSAELGKPERMENGMLRVPARLTRTGVFPYTQADGTVKNVLREPAEVFAADSLKTFELAPLTLRHPPGEVNARNFKQYAVGSVGMVRADGDFVSASLLVADADAVAAINGGLREISSGYYADLEPAPVGSFFTDVNGTQVPYEFTHKNIRGNHVALVKEGRAGPQVRLMMDASEELHPTKTEETKQMEKLTIDGVTIEVSATAREVVTKMNDASNAKIAKLTKDSEVSLAQVEALKSRAEAAEAKLKEVSAPAFLAAAVAERMAIAAVAAKHGLQVDSLDNHAARCAVIAKINPKLVTDGRSADAVIAMFDVLSTVSVESKEVSVIADTAAKLTTDSKAAAHRAAFFNNFNEVK